MYIFIKNHTFYLKIGTLSLNESLGNKLCFHRKIAHFQMYDIFSNSKKNFYRTQDFGYFRRQYNFFQIRNFYPEQGLNFAKPPIIFPVIFRSK